MSAKLSPHFSRYYCKTNLQKYRTTLGAPHAPKPVTRKKAYSMVMFRLISKIVAMSGRKKT